MNSLTSILTGSISLFLILPLIAFFATLIWNNRQEKPIANIVQVTKAIYITASVAFAVLWFVDGYSPISQHLVTLYATDNFVFAIQVYYDETTAVFSVVGAVIFFLVSTFSRYYMHRDEGFKRFFNTILLFAVGYNLIIFSGNFETLFFGWLSDKVGRKWIMLTGMLLGVLFYRPIFQVFLKDSHVKSHVSESNIQYSNTRSDTISYSKGVRIIQHMENGRDHAGTFFIEKRSDTLLRVLPITSIDGMNPGPHLFSTTPDQHPVYADVKLAGPLKWKFILLVWVMIIFVTMVYGPIAAFLVEMFPTKIRYTSMSLPYHIGNGVFGGLVPFIGLLLTTSFPADPLVGLWYPIGVAALCLLIGTVYLRNKIDENIDD